MIEQKLKCECGTREDEHEEINEHGKAQRKIAYVPELYLCPACKAAGDLLESAFEVQKKTNASTNGIKVRILPKYIADMRKETVRAQTKLIAEARAQEKANLSLIKPN